MPATPARAWTARVLLGWYDAGRRELPWRSAPGETPDPYKVWLSEIMLQQTTVKAVAPYYAAFLKRWPRVEDLAAASIDDVLKAWAGLGYYSRARNLHACARIIAGERGGRFPGMENELRVLPGIGDYTAAAIAAIAFSRRAAVVDGNVERVLARLFAIEKPLPAAKKDLRSIAVKLAPDKRPGDFAQAMMDLGATVCTPRAPSCKRCPLARRCAGRAMGVQDALPYRSPAKAKPTRRGAAFIVRRSDGALLLRKREARGLLGGMAEVPCTDWLEAESGSPVDPLAQAPVDAAWSPVPGLVRHTFTHFHLELAVFRAEVAQGAELREAAKPVSCMWVPRREIDGQALPSLMRKVLAHALA